MDRIEHNLKKLNALTAELAINLDGPKNILIIEDEVALRADMAEYLRDNGYKVIESTNGIEALALLNKYDFSTVILDLNIPLINGVRLSKEIVKMKKDIDVVVITGHDELAKKLNGCNIKAIIFKPFNVEQLKKVLEKKTRLNRKRDG